MDMILNDFSKKHYKLLFLGIFFFTAFFFNACKKEASFNIRGDINIINTPSNNFYYQNTSTESYYQAKVGETLKLTINKDYLDPTKKFLYLEITSFDYDNKPITDKLYLGDEKIIKINSHINLRAVYTEIQYYNITPIGLASNHLLNDLIQFYPLNKDDYQNGLYKEGSKVKYHVNKLHPIFRYYAFEGLNIQNQLYLENNEIEMTQNILYNVELKQANNFIYVPENLDSLQIGNIKLAIKRDYELLKLIPNDIDESNKAYPGDLVEFKVVNLSYNERKHELVGLFVDNKAYPFNELDKLEVKENSEFNIRAYTLLKKGIDLVNNPHFQITVFYNNKEIINPDKLYKGDLLKVKLLKNFDVAIGERLRRITLNGNLYKDYTNIIDMSFNDEFKLTNDNLYNEIKFDYVKEMLNPVNINILQNEPYFNIANYLIKVDGVTRSDLLNLKVYPYQEIEVEYQYPNLNPNYLVFDKFIFNNHIYYDQFKYMIQESDYDIDLEYHLKKDPKYYKVNFKFLNLIDGHEPNLKINNQVAREYYHKELESILNLLVDNFYLIEKITINGKLLDNTSLINYQILENSPEELNIEISLVKR